MVEYSGNVTENTGYSIGPFYCDDGFQDHES